MTTRITEIEEIYDADGQSISVVFGKAELTIAQKMRSDMSEVKTALSAPAGIAEVTEALDAVSGTLGNLSEVDPDIQGETFTATVNNLFGKLPTLEITVGAGTISAGQYALRHMEPGDSLYFTSWSGNKFSDQPSDDGQVFLVKHNGDSTGTGYQRAMGFFISRNTMTFYVISIFIYNNPSGTANWLNINNEPITTARLASGAVTTAKIAQEADASVTYSLGSGVTMGANMSFVNKGVVSIGMQVNVGSSGVASGGTILTITNANFYPYATVRSVATAVGGSGTNMPITISASGVVANAASSTLPTGYYLISCSYARA